VLKLKTSPVIGVVFSLTKFQALNPCSGIMWLKICRWTTTAHSYYGNNCP